ncbi:hypothetical protein Ciccas_004446 [Cichlidogyrus casuarinus]|uniref:Protein RIC1 homolog n=1 Tax=Cichlidogyrus casuarinus TaxID=1844966 RepID=A0ABD2QDT2_9PLAT
MSEYKFTNETLRCLQINTDSHSAIHHICANYRFRCVALAARKEIDICILDDSTYSSLMITHSLSLPSKEYFESLSLLGNVEKMSWSPDGYCLAVIWENQGLALWSVSGSLIYCSLSSQIGPTFNPRFSNILWSENGHFLWTAMHCEEDGRDYFELVNFSLARSSVVSNPISDNHRHILLQTADSVIFGARWIMDTGENSLPNPDHSSSSRNSLRNLLTIPLMDTYILNNWPIKMCAVDFQGLRIVVAGQRGFMYYSLALRKWRLFGNLHQEKAIEVVNGLGWWGDFIYTTCYISDNTYPEIRFYSTREKLDDDFRSSLPLKNDIRPVLCDIVGANYFVLLTSDSFLNIYNLLVNTKKPDFVTIQPLKSVNLATTISYPNCVTRICFVSSSLSYNPSDAFPDNLLINYAGTLFNITSRYNNTSEEISVVGKQNLKHRHSSESSYSPSVLVPSPVASHVELFWTARETMVDSKSSGSMVGCAVWIYCGSLGGVLVWLPLVDKTGNPSQEPPVSHRTNRRIMLTCKLPSTSTSIIPFVILSESVIMVGVTNEFQSRALFEQSKKLKSATTESWQGDKLLPHIMFPYGSAVLAIEPLLHRLIKQLLKMNLDYYALQLAFSFKNWELFPQMLELLLHDVLEEEVTSKKPIPDPLLPQAASFVQEFPAALDVIAHCARKTEVEWWPLLFQAVGRSARDLFMDSLEADQLETASAYLIVLQTFENIRDSTSATLRLLETAVTQCKWKTARDLIRFLQAIDPSEFVEKCRSRTSSASSEWTCSRTPPSRRSLLNPSKQRITSPIQELDQPKSPPSAVPTETKLSDNHGPSIILLKVEQMMETIALRYLNERKLCQLSRLWANIGEFIEPREKASSTPLCNASSNHDLPVEIAEDLDPFVYWISKRNYESLLVNDWPETLVTLHKEFHWPAPCYVSNVPKPTSEWDSGSTKDNGSCEVIYSYSAKANSPVKSKLRAEASSDDALDGVSIATSRSDSSASTLVIVGHTEEQSLGKAGRGLRQQKRQLRFLFSQLLQADSIDVNFRLKGSCLDLACLLALMLLDRTGLLQVISLACTGSVPSTQNSSTKNAPPIVFNPMSRILNGLEQLKSWSSSQSMGYYAFLCSLQPRIDKTVDEILSKNLSRPMREILQSKGKSRILHKSDRNSRTSEVHPKNATFPFNEEMVEAITLAAKTSHIENVQKDERKNIFQGKTPGNIRNKWPNNLYDPQSSLAISSTSNREINNEDLFNSELETHTSTCQLM